MADAERARSTVGGQVHGQVYCAGASRRARSRTLEAHVKIHSESRIPYPREQVFLAYRDRMAEIAEFIPDIKEIRVVTREESDGQVILHNEWVSDREVPRVVGKIIKPEHIHCVDFATWDYLGSCATWQLKTRASTEAVSCAGTTEVIADGDGCTVRLTGDLNIALKEIKGVPNFLAKRMAPQLEKFIVSLVTPNLQQVNRSIERFLDAEVGQ
jgi:hypothetical protein